MSLLDRLRQNTFGKLRYKVEFNLIYCRRTNFSDYDRGGGDIDNIEEYGLAIYAAKIFKENEWYLTDKNILVSGKGKRGVGTLRVNIDIEKSIHFLPEFIRRYSGSVEFIRRYSGSVREGYAVNVFIEGLDLPKGTVIGPRPGYWAVFLGIPK